MIKIVNCAKCRQKAENNLIRKNRHVQGYWTDPIFGPDHKFYEGTIQNTNIMKDDSYRVVS